MFSKLYEVTRLEVEDFGDKIYWAEMVCCVSLRLVSVVGNKGPDKDILLG